MFAKVKKLILDTLFPLYCLDCHQEGFWICPKCFSRIETLPFQVCPRCERLISEGGKLCQRCKNLSLKLRDFSLTALIVAGNYKDESLAKMIHLFKYNFIEDLKTPLGTILVRSFQEHRIPLPDGLIPVPLHPRKLRARGFNQAALLAQFLGENLAPGFTLPVLEDILKRTRSTRSQMKIKDYRERRTNVQGAFELFHPEKIRNKSLLLVDDVATTGATLLECARLLKAAGAKKVSALVVARQGFGPPQPPF